MKKIVYPLSVIMMNSFSYATLLSELNLDNDNEHLEVVVVRERTGYKNAVDNMNSDELKQEGKKVKQHLTHLCNELYSMPAIHNDTFPNIFKKILGEESYIKWFWVTEKRREEFHKRKEEYKRYFVLAKEIDDLSYHLRCILEKRNKDLNESHLLRLSNSFFRTTTYDDLGLPNKPPKPGKVIQSIANRERWQTDYRDRISELKGSVQGNRSVSQRFSEGAERFNKKAWLDFYSALNLVDSTNGKMKTAKFCAQWYEWYESRRDRLPLSSDQRRAKWAEYCKGWSDDFKKINSMASDMSGMSLEEKRGLQILIKDSDDFNQSKL